MKMLLTLAMLAFLVPEANAEIGKPKVFNPDNGECVVIIVQSPSGKDKEQQFLNAVQKHLEDGYVARGNIAVLRDSKGGRKLNATREIMHISLFKEKC